MTNIVKKITDVFESFKKKGVFILYYIKYYNINFFFLHQREKNKKKEKKGFWSTTSNHSLH